MCTVGKHAKEETQQQNTYKNVEVEVRRGMNPNQARRQVCKYIKMDYIYNISALNIKETVLKRYPYCHDLGA
jgi:hypothetical protein